MKMTMNKLNLAAQLTGELTAASMNLFEERFLKAINSDAQHIYVVAAYREITRDMREAMARQDGPLNYAIVYMPPNGITPSIEAELTRVLPVAKILSFVY